VLDPRAGLNQKTIKRLKERAQLNGRTLEHEVKALLERAAKTLTMPEARRVRSGGGTGSVGGRCPAARD
jgi:plasmid stability protein